MRFHLFAMLIVSALAISLSACNGGGGSAQASPSAPPSPESAASSATASPAEQASAEASASAGETPSAAATGATAAPPPPSPEPNLLSYRAGTILRAYPASLANPENAIGGEQPADGSHGPYVYVFELPGVAAISSFAVTLPENQDGKQGLSATFAVSTTGATDGFRDVGSARSGDTGDAVTIAANTQGRWIRLTVQSPDARTIQAVSAAGTVQPRPSGAADPSGTYVETNNPYSSGVWSGKSPPGENPWWVRIVTMPGGVMSGAECNDTKTDDMFPGNTDGRAWILRYSSGAPQRMVVNDDASIIVGQSDARAYLIRTNDTPAGCTETAVGSGPHKWLVLTGSNSELPWPVIHPAQMKGYQYEITSAPWLTSSLLAGKEALVLNDMCKWSDYLSPQQGQTILDFVSSGGKLVIYDADVCRKTDYAFLPYPFTTDNPGGNGERGNSLLVVEDDELGTTDKSDQAHYFDPKPYVAYASNQLGDANTVETQDSHWCGHLFGTNGNNVNGFMQMYAFLGKGTIIYDGFDVDDAAVPANQRVHVLEWNLPIPNQLPCTQKTSLSFLVEPDRSGSFVPGKAATLTFPMEVLANQGWKGHVTLSATGDFPAAVTPSALDMSGGTHAISVAIAIPASAKAGQYAITATGDAGNGVTAHATVQLEGIAPVVVSTIVKQIKQNRRIRLYGIHFDVDSAHIQPKSEPVIAQLAQMMKQNPQWHFRVEGHTDSDGGYAHNQVLSTHRAQSVVSDLVHRYHIAQVRLVPVGYGYSRPVATNSTVAGKALNRRVELYRL